LSGSLTMRTSSAIALLVLAVTQRERERMRRALVGLTRGRGAPASLFARPVCRRAPILERNPPRTPIGDVRSPRGPGQMERGRRFHERFAISWRRLTILSRTASLIATSSGARHSMADTRRSIRKKPLVTRIFPPKFSETG
jgi:hypothetical protein